MHNMKISEKELLTIVNDYYEGLWEDMEECKRVVGISKAINENGAYYYELQIEEFSDDSE